MTSRVLPQVEWSKLDATLMASLWRTFDPQYTEIIVVEERGEIVGSVALLTTLHAECVSNRGGVAVARKLWQALTQRVHAAGGRAVWGAAIDEPMRTILDHHGESIPGEHFLVRV